MFTISEATDAAKITMRSMSVPMREPSYSRPPYWALPLNETRTRPIPALSGWLNYITIHMGQQPGLAPAGYSARVQYYIASGEVSPITSGLLYRFVYNGVLLRSEEFDITNDIERHIDHLAAMPFPAQPRRLDQHVRNDGRLVLQVNNTGGAIAMAFAALMGYYYPNLGDRDRGALERGSGNDDTVR